MLNRGLLFLPRKYVVLVYTEFCELSCIVGGDANLRVLARDKPRATLLKTSIMFGSLLRVWSLIRCLAEQVVLTFFSHSNGRVSLEIGREARVAINDRLLAICRLIILCGTIELTCGKGLHSARLEVRCTLFISRRIR